MPTLEDDGPEIPEIVIHCAGSGESFALDPDEETWLNMQAYCEAAGVSVQELINMALEEFFDTYGA